MLSDDSMRVVDKTRAVPVVVRHTATRDERARVRIRRIESHRTRARTHTTRANQPRIESIRQRRQIG